ncbi:MAG: ActD-like protein, partial [Myxococcales bacterium]|nr:ActD-like protein [Myxococcales bacterium]
QRAEVEAELAREPGGQARLEALRREDARVLEQYPPRPMVAAITQRAEAERERARRRRLWSLGVPALAVAAAAILLLVVRPFSSYVAPPGGGAGGGGAGGGVTGVDPGVRLKGGPLLLVYRKGDGDRSTRLSSGATARAGDRLQIVYVAGWARYGVVFSVDGNGSLTRHLPRSAGSAAALAPGGKPHRLPSSFELDDAPRFERVFFIASKTPFDPEPLVAAARKLASPESKLGAPDGIVIKQLLLRKANAGGAR